MSIFTDLLNSTNAVLTLFAPTNESFDDIDLLSVDPDMLVGNHLVRGTLKEADLMNNRRFTTLAETQLHSTTVVFSTYSPVIRHQSYHTGYYTQTRVVSKLLVLAIYVQ